MAFIARLLRVVKVRGRFRDYSATITHIDLCVTSAASGPLVLYTGAGFKVWGVESAALTVRGQSMDLYHLMRAL